MMNSIPTHHYSSPSDRHDQEGGQYAAYHYPPYYYPHTPPPHPPSPYLACHHGAWSMSSSSSTDETNCCDEYENEYYYCMFPSPTYHLCIKQVEFGLDGMYDDDDYYEWLVGESSCFPEESLLEHLVCFEKEGEPGIRDMEDPLWQHTD